MSTVAAQHKCHANGVGFRAADPAQSIGSVFYFYLQVTFIELIDLVFALSEMPEFLMSIPIKFQSAWVFNSLLSLVLCVSFFVLAFFFRRVFGSSWGDHLPVRKPLALFFTFFQELDWPSDMSDCGSFTQTCACCRGSCAWRNLGYLFWTCSLVVSLLQQNILSSSLLSGGVQLIHACISAKLYERNRLGGRMPKKLLQLLSWFVETRL